MDRINMIDRKKRNDEVKSCEMAEARAKMVFLCKFSSQN